MLRFISFGSGSSGNCYYLYTDTDGILIDTGIGIRTLKKHFSDYGVSLAVVRNILITHDHADHVKSVGNVSCEYNIPVYATEKVHQGIRRNYCVRKKINQNNIRFVHKGDTLRVGEFAVTPFSVPHDSADNVGYKIEHGGIKFCLITDAGHVTEEMARYIKEANYLVIEANHDEEMLVNGPYPAYLKERIGGPNGHLCNRCCAKAVAENATQDLRYVWLCHLSLENNHPELARKTIEMILGEYGIVAGHDLMLDVLKRRMPSGIYELK